MKIPVHKYLVFKEINGDPETLIGQYRDFKDAQALASRKRQEYNNQGVNGGQVYVAKIVHILEVR